MIGKLTGVAMRELTRNVKRTLLTVLGVVVGTGTLVLVLSLGEGLEQVIYQQLGMLSPNAMWVEVRVPKSTRSGSPIDAVNIKTMNDKDQEAIEKLPNVDATYGWYTGQGKIKAGKQNQTSLILAVGDKYNYIQGTNMRSGRFFTAKEDRSRQKLVVLGSDLAEDLASSDEEIIGKNVKIDNKSFRVIGVMASQGSSGFFNPDTVAYIPVRTGQSMWGVQHLQAIVVNIIDMEKAERTRWRTAEILRQNHDIDSPEKDDFQITTSDEALSIVGDVTGGISILLGALAGISLVVGGVGIMNVMYVTVTERTREIGLRKSIGAPRRAILMQFLIEAVLITLLGGVIGVIGGALLSWIASVGAGYAGYGWDFTIPSMAVVLALSVSVGIGLLFGYRPAKRAASLDPISALRSE